QLAVADLVVAAVENGQVRLADSAVLIEGAAHPDAAGTIHGKRADLVVESTKAAVVDASGGVGAFQNAPRTREQLTVGLKRERLNHGIVIGGVIAKAGTAVGVEAAQVVLRTGAIAGQD